MNSASPHYALLTGLALCAVTGLLWAVLGGMMARVAERTASPSGFYAVAYGLAALLGWIVTVDWHALGSTGRLGELIAWTAGAGIMSAGYQLTLAVAFRRGPRGISWAVVQSALVVPFVLGVVVWGDHVGPTGWGGLALVLAALPLLGGTRGTPTPTGWAPWVTAAFLCVACQQTMAGVPSRWPGWSDAAHLRPTLACTATAAVQLLGAALTRSSVRRHDLLLALAYAVMLLASFTTLFAALDHLARLQAGAAVFPLAVGISILAFVNWHAVVSHEALDWRHRLGLGLLITGILAVATR